MAYFAKIEEGVVTKVIAINNDVLNGGGAGFPDTEVTGQDYISNVLNFSGDWKQTSYNSNFRFNYAGVGHTFQPESGTDGAFIPPQPFPSWALDENLTWRPPVRYPLDSDQALNWDEEVQNWVSENE